MVKMYVRNMLAGLARWQYEKLLTCAEVASELGPRLIIRWMLLTMNGRSNSSIASSSNGEVVCAQYAGRCSSMLAGVAVDMRMRRGCVRGRG